MITIADTLCGPYRQRILTLGPGMSMALFKQPLIFIAHEPDEAEPYQGDVVVHDLTPIHA